MMFVVGIRIKLLVFCVEVDFKEEDTGKLNLESYMHLYIDNRVSNLGLINICV